FFFQAEDGIRDGHVTGVQTCAFRSARDVFEGDDVRVDLVVESTGSVAPPTLVAHERPGHLDERRVELRRVGRDRFAGGFDLRAVDRKSVVEGKGGGGGGGRGGWVRW